jgi:hypothetical protein
MTLSPITGLEKPACYFLKIFKNILDNPVFCLIMHVSLGKRLSRRGYRIKGFSWCLLTPRRERSNKNETYLAYLIIPFYSPVVLLFVMALV